MQPLPIIFHPSRQLRAPLQLDQGPTAPQGDFKRMHLSYNQQTCVRKLAEVFENQVCPLKSLLCVGDGASCSFDKIGSSRSLA